LQEANWTKFCNYVQISLFQTYKITVLLLIHDAYSE